MEGSPRRIDRRAVVRGIGRGIAATGLVSAGVVLDRIFGKPSSESPSQRISAVPNASVGLTEFTPTAEQQKKLDAYDQMWQFIVKYTNSRIMDGTPLEDADVYEIIALGKESDKLGSASPTHDAWQLRLPKDSTNPDQFAPTISLVSKLENPESTNSTGVWELRVFLDKKGNVIAPVKKNNPNLSLTEAEMKRAFNNFVEAPLLDENWVKIPSGDDRSQSIHGHWQYPGISKDVLMLSSGYVDIKVRVGPIPQPQK